jgi:hypothetical protein
MVVPVLYDPSDHAKLVVDESKEAWKPADRENSLRSSAAAYASHHPGEDPTKMAAMDKIRRAAVSDPEGFKKLMREQGPAAFGLPGPVLGTFPMGAPTSRDPLDRLAKLADLHDRGVLTDAEFETQKEKLLGE